jgi:gamma-butyrobetaine dioxygenase
MRVQATIEILDSGRAVAFAFAGGDRRRFHAIWLRDNAWDETTRAPGNGQKLTTLADLPADIRVTAARAEGSRVWLTFAPEARTLCYDLGWLADHAYDRLRSNARGWVSSEVYTWDAALGARLPVGDFTAVGGSRAALRAWLHGVRRYGVGRLVGGPVESGALYRVAALFGYVRETNYGRHFEVRSEIDPSNLAYTSLGLQAHTDNPYRDPVPTLQILYCLANSAEGGENLVVDGFAVARRLRDEDPAAFDLLARYCARFEYAGEPGVRLRARRPVIELAPDGELVGVRFNNRSAAALTDVPFEDMEGYYDALRRFAAIVDDPAMAVTFKLAPGDCFLVDNTRVLHGRTGFSGTGSRWLQGCYADKDGLLSTLAALEADA